jgi:hypothetical protein
VPSESNIALKEWQAVVAALTGGRLIVLLRKGGIVEEHGEFRLEHRGFFLYPTYVHQSAGMLKAGFAERVESRAAEPAVVPITAFASVTDILHPCGLDAVLAVEPYGVWHSSFLHMRWNYKPQNPLFLLLVRVFRLPAAVELTVTPEYAGCQSWVTMERALTTAGATPVLSDDEYERRRQEIRRAVGR